jgi:hypothetical protein
MINPRGYWEGTILGELFRNINIFSEKLKLSFAFNKNEGKKLSLLFPATPAELSHHLKGRKWSEGLQLHEFKFKWKQIHVFFYIYRILKTWTLKVLSNEKEGWSGKWQMIGIGLGLRRSSFVCLLILLPSLILCISVSASKAKSIGNVLTNKQNVALRTMFFSFFFNGHCLLTHQIILGY